MRQLLNFIYRYRAFAVFLILEIICFRIIIDKNTYQQASFLASSNKVAGNVYDLKSGVTDYLSLQDVNNALANENAELRQQLNALTETAPVNRQIGRPPKNNASLFSYTAAKIISNSVLFSDNYLTIDKGSAHGIMPGMGVIGGNGVVGQVKACSENFATVYSLLHAETMVSSEIKKNRTLASTKWDGQDPRIASLMYVSKYVPVSTGDTIVTSGYNAVFPEGTLLGTVWSIENKPEEAYQNIEIKLSTDFSKIKYVYVVQNPYKAEIDSLASFQ